MNNFFLAHSVLVCHQKIVSKLCMTLHKIIPEGHSHGCFLLFNYSRKFGGEGNKERMETKNNLMQ